MSAMLEVPREQFTSVIREMIRHENDLTNHRIMWLLIGQGFFANAYFSAKGGGVYMGFTLPLVGILVTLSAFLMLYKSYQAKAYLQFIGMRAKLGTLREEYLPLMGWPKRRIKGWWRNVCVCRWFVQISDLLEPWLLLPSIFMFMWTYTLLRQWTWLYQPVSVIVTAIFTAGILFGSCFLLVWSQSKDEDQDN